VTVALQRETRTIPIVFAQVADPVASGVVARLDHPGGNITGFAAARSRNSLFRFGGLDQRSRFLSVEPQFRSMIIEADYVNPSGAYFA
jgi:hypothetical protein